MLWCISDVIGEDSYISTYHCPEPNAESAVQMASLSGFCAPERLLDALSDLQWVFFLFYIFSCA